MELGKVIKDLKDMRNAGFIDCNIQCFLDQLEKVTESVVVDKFIADWYEKHKDCLDYYIWEWNKLNCVKETGRSEMDDKLNFIRFSVVLILISMCGFSYCMDKKLDDTQNERKQIVVKQGEHIKKLAEQNKAQDVIINKLNAEYNLKGKKK